MKWITYIDILQDGANVSCFCSQEIARLALRRIEGTIAEEDEEEEEEEEEGWILLRPEHKGKESRAEEEPIKRALTAENFDGPLWVNEEEEEETEDKSIAIARILENKNKIKIKIKIESSVCDCLWLSLESRKTERERDNLMEIAHFNRSRPNPDADPTVLPLLAI